MDQMFQASLTYTDEEEFLAKFPLREHYEELLKEYIRNQAGDRVIGWDCRRERRNLSPTEDPTYLVNVITVRALIREGEEE